MKISEKRQSARVEKKMPCNISFNEKNQSFQAIIKNLSTEGLRIQVNLSQKILITTGSTVTINFLVPLELHCKGEVVHYSYEQNQDLIVGIHLQLEKPELKKRWLDFCEKAS